MAWLGKWLGELALSWLFNIIKAQILLKKKINDKKGKIDKHTDKIVAIAEEIKATEGPTTAEQKRRLIDAAKNSRNMR